VQAFIPFPNISPDVFSFELGGITLALRWYALAYIAGLLIGWRMVMALMARPALWPQDRAPMPPPLVEALLTWVVIGVILGGRLGFILVYQPGLYLGNPASILRVWEGGMSFHGGFIGVVVAGWIFCRKHKIPPLQMGDAMAMVAPVGLFLGRIANFINAELWGRPTTQPWGVSFPGQHAQTCPFDWQGVCARHPTQLYEAVLEGLALGTLLVWLVYRRGGLKVPGQITGLFIAGYGTARFIVEFWRQADAQFITLDNPMGYVVHFGQMGFSMGQLLSLPMVAFGLALVAYARSRRTVE
jgi:phosphatidylglycerol:prolipoprotein diacylglycerol transferase